MGELGDAIGGTAPRKPRDQDRPTERDGHRRDVHVPDRKRDGLVVHRPAQ
jgi:hypothetical protein